MTAKFRHNERMKEWVATRVERRELSSIYSFLYDHVGFNGGVYGCQAAIMESREGTLRGHRERDNGVGG